MLHIVILKEFLFRKHFLFLFFLVLKLSRNVGFRELKLFLVTRGSLPFSFLLVRPDGLGRGAGVPSRKWGGQLSCQHLAFWQRVTGQGR